MAHPTPMMDGIRACLFSKTIRPTVRDAILRRVAELYLQTLTAHQLAYRKRLASGWRRPAPTEEQRQRALHRQRARRAAAKAAGLSYT